MNDFFSWQFFQALLKGRRPNAVTPPAAPASCTKEVARFTGKVDNIFKSEEYFIITGIQTWAAIKYSYNLRE